MIENIRKYTGLMIVVFVILFISFFFLDTSAIQSVGGGGAVIKVDGRTYNDKDFRKLGPNSLDLTYSLAQPSDFGIYQFIMTLGGNAASQDEMAGNFFVGRMILRDAREEFGVHPGSEEVSTYLRTLRAFAGPDGAFSEERYRNLIERVIGRLGMTESDLRELATDIIVSKKINEIVGSGLGADRNAVAWNLALENQQITARLGHLNLAPHEEAIEPGEEEIKTYWETLRDAFTTEPKRKFTYVLVTPDLPEEPEEPSLPEDASEEDKEAAEEARAKRAADLAQQRREKQLEADRLVDDFLFDLEQHHGSGFEDLAKENGWEIRTTGMFPRSEAPAELDVDLRGSSRGGKAVDLLFQIEASGSDPFAKISEAIPIGEGQWLVAHLDEEEKSRPMTFEEARDEARAQYIEEKATEALKTAAEEALAKIREAVEAGKSFEEAATEAGLESVKEVASYNRFYRPDTESEPSGLFEATRTVDPGSFAELVVEPDRAFIILVEKREVVKDEINAARIDSETNSRANENETIAFLSWMKARTDAANVQTLGPR